MTPVMESGPILINVEPSVLSSVRREVGGCIVFTFSH